MTDLLVSFFILALILTGLKVALYALLFQSEIRAAIERDPAATGSLAVILSYPGLHALFYYRVGRIFYKAGLLFFARLVTQFGRFLTGIEIHPGAHIGRGLFIDHGMGVVIGETAVIGKNVTLFQGVTLGGTGKHKGKRHPTLGDNVVVGAGAKILGNIRIGDNVSVGANAVVIHDVSPNSTVVGVPGRVTRREGRRVEGVNVDYTNLPDPISRAIHKLQHEMGRIEKELKDKYSK